MILMLQEIQQDQLHQNLKVSQVEQKMESLLTPIESR